MKTFHLILATFGKTLFEGDVLAATFPGKEGVFQVLADHEPYVSELKEGTVRVTASDNQTHAFPISAGGIVEVSSNHATVLL